MIPTDDIAEKMRRLAALKSPFYGIQGLCAEAAEEIERLRGPTTIKRPDWNEIYKDCVGGGERPNELVSVTRETLRLSQHALRKMNEDDYYHNNGAAEQEIIAALKSRSE